MKNSSITIFLTLFLSPLWMSAQDQHPIDGHSQSWEDSLTVKNQALPPIDVNFLFSYYDQDGVHSAVTGGQGTEELTDRAGKIILNLPLDSVSTLGIETGLNHYTSASTDRIDFRVSSASRRDSRAFVKMSYAKANLKHKSAWSIHAGGSIESDYISSSIGGTWSKENPAKNREYQLTFQAYLDKWIVIFPEELRNDSNEFVRTDKRRSFHFGAVVNQVINKRMQAGVSADFVYQQGLLSTPFHRVYFQGDSISPRVEQLPGHRLKFPIGLRLNYFAGNFSILRFYYRYYIDNFGIQAHTFNLETPLKAGKIFTFYPFYRFHTQTASQYFQPFAQHLPNVEFYTSDFDLSSFYSHKYGLGINISPTFGIARFKISSQRASMFKQIGFRYSRYSRSDGLSAAMWIGEVSFLLY